MRIGLYNDAFLMSPENQQTAEVDAIVRNQTVTFKVVAGPMIMKGFEHVYENVFVLVIDYEAQEAALCRRLPLRGFGAHSFVDFGNAASAVAHAFCKERGWVVNTEMNHWPVLQFMCSKPEVAKTVKEMNREANFRQGDTYNAG